MAEAETEITHPVWHGGCQYFSTWTQMEQHVFNSAIHKAAGRCSASSWNNPWGRSNCQLHSWLMGVSGIVPGKIMERPGTVRPAAL